MVKYIGRSINDCQDNQSKRILQFNNIPLSDSDKLPLITANYRRHFRFHLFGTSDFVKAITTTKCREAVPHLETALLNHFEPAKRQVCTVPGPPRNRERRKIVDELAVIIGGIDSRVFSFYWMIRLHHSCHHCHGKNR